MDAIMDDGIFRLIDAYPPLGITVFSVIAAICLTSFVTIGMILMRIGMYCVIKTDEYFRKLEKQNEQGERQKRN